MTVQMRPVGRYGITFLKLKFLQSEITVMQTSVLVEVKSKELDD